MASWRLCGRHIRIRESSITGKFAQARHYDKHVGLSFWIAVRRTKVSDISDSKCRGLRGEFASSKGQPPGGAPTDLTGEFFASCGLLAIKSSLLRALRVLRGENFFTVKPGEALFITDRQR